MVPIGTIVIWSGTLDNIPAGWQLCDGTNGTPALRNRFVRGAGTTIIPHVTGGSSTHTHQFTGSGHNHQKGTALAIHGPGADEAWDANDDSSSEQVEGVTELGGTLPMFYNLAYIQRMS